MSISIHTAANTVLQMESDLQKRLKGKDKKFWQNTYIKKQIDKRIEAGEEAQFTLEDHIRAMVYAMLSSCRKWSEIEDMIDPETGRIPPVDEAFLQYDTKQLPSTKEELQKIVESKLNDKKYLTDVQYEALAEVNIPKLIEWNKKPGGIDGFYKTFLDRDPTGLSLVKALSETGENKLAGLGEALASEYLRNVGYDYPKPDRHIRRMLGGKRLAFSEREDATPKEAFVAVRAIADEIGQEGTGPAKVDYILWSYCASGYGEICTADPKCSECAANKLCRYPKRNEAVK